MRGTAAEQTDERRSLLRSSGERTRQRRAAEQRDDRAAVHSITQQV